jgi:hypothetical protein
MFSKILVRRVTAPETPRFVWTGFIKGLSAVSQPGDRYFSNGPTPTCGDVRVCAAVGEIADTAKLLYQAT